MFSRCTHGVLDGGDVLVAEAVLEPGGLVRRALVVEDVHRGPGGDVEAEEVHVAGVGVLVIVRGVDAPQAAQQVRLVCNSDASGLARRTARQIEKVPLF